MRLAPQVVLVTVLTVAVGVCTSGVEAQESVASPLAGPGHTGRVESFLAATAAYGQGDYAAATAGFAQLVAAGGENGYLYYNLGNAQLRGGDLAAAIASYRKAQWLLPRDENVRANLDFARQSGKDQITAAEPGVWRTLFFWHFNLAPNELWGALLLSNALLWLLFSVRLYAPTNEIFGWLKWFALSGLVAFGGSLLWKTQWPPQVVVVKSAEAKAYSGTDRDSVVRFVLHAGAEAEWSARQDGWYRVRLADGKTGWLQAADIRTLTL